MVDSVCGKGVATFRHNTCVIVAVMTRIDAEYLYMGIRLLETVERLLSKARCVVWPCVGRPSPGVEASISSNPECGRVVTVKRLL